ncbi:MAG TPA: hypothetical protein PLC65_02785, partial [Bacteroidia bacterium]|nr:hypothetical protein [Bacteroidia bacterium]
MMLVKFTLGGSRLWATYLGSPSAFTLGGFGSWAYSLVLDGIGSIYLSGMADLNFPVTSGAYQTTIGGSFDAVIVKFREGSVVSGLENIKFISEETHIFPNPNSGSFSIQTKEDVVLEIVNELGQVVRNIKL